MKLPGDTLSVQFADTLPFGLEHHEFIFVDNAIGSRADRYVHENYAKICAAFGQYGATFCHLRMEAELNCTVARVNYSNPDIGNVLPVDSLCYRQLFLPHQISPQRPLDDGILWCDTNHQYHYVPFTSVNELLQCLKEENDWHKKVHLSSVPNIIFKPYGPQGNSEPEEFADNHFNSETGQLIQEVKQRIQELQLRGVDERILRALVQPTSHLSPLVITHDYRIFLPDYDNKEVRLAPLPKAIYILFLRHPEGILFKHLPDYAKELSEIYQDISTRCNIEKLQESIQKVTDPTNNSINEKCTRIKEAFLLLFDDYIACHYYISGEAASPKGVHLPPELIRFE